MLYLATLAVARAEVVVGPRLATAIEADHGMLLMTELNCAACHQTEADGFSTSSRKSPLLGRGGLQITPQYLRRYLADPAGYKLGSTMPHLLHHLNPDDKAETVEALVHFLISEQDRSAPRGNAAEDFLLRRGRELFHTVGCVACHEPQAPPDGAATLQGPPQIDPSLLGLASVPLGDLARKTTVDQLAGFLLDPLKIRPSGRMPSLNLTTNEAAAIAVYLLREQAAGLTDPDKRSLVAGLKFQYYEETFGSVADFEKMTPKLTGTTETFDVKSRRRNEHFGFRFTGSIRISRPGDYTFFTTSDDGSMLYIDDKVVVDNGGDHGSQERQGQIHLSPGDHTIAVTFYNIGGGFELSVSWSGPGFEKQPIPSVALSHFGIPMIPLEDEEFTIDREKANKGRQLFASLGCASCHALGGVTVASANRAQPLNAANSSNGCLSENPAKGIPKFALTSQQRAAIVSTIARLDSFKVLSASQQVTATMARLNCHACHSRDGKGGPVNARVAYFRVAGELDMGDEGRIPPHLTAVGAKLRPEWTHEVLVNEGRVRSYMATRMPQYGPPNVGGLAGTLEEADARGHEVAEPEVTLRDSKYGRRLAGSGGLSCIACHGVGPFKSLGIPAIDLAQMTHRLRYDWFLRYLVNPPSLRPGTRMPSFWPNGEAVNKDILGGDTKAQIKALWAYFESSPETDLPDGLVQGRMELVAEREPLIYRNFIQGAGTRAIGVGYPEKVNLAFDANNIRLAMIWQGPFIDAARHWSGRGEGFESPLGNNILKMPDGPAFAFLENEQAPWPSVAGREGGFKMGGYRLDEKRRPTFFYKLGEVRIEESYEPVIGEVDAYIRRKISVGGSGEGRVWFRAAAGNLEENGEAFVLDGKARIKIAGPSALLRGSGGNKELLVPLQLTKNGTKIVQEIVW